MLKSILFTSLRGIVRNKLFSIINLLGLSVSMALGLLLILIVVEQYGYDTFHKDADRIYRINTLALRVEGEDELYASAPLPLGRVLKEDYSFIEEVARLNQRLNVEATYNDATLRLHGLFADPSFLSVFNFQLDRGDISSVLAQPNSLVLTSECAVRVFGQNSPIGQIISLGKLGEFVVTGVLKPFPGKTHLDFEVLAPLGALPQLEARKIIHSDLDDWNNHYTGYVYFKLKEGSRVADVEDALQQISQKQYTGVELEARDKGYVFELIALPDITPGPPLSNQMGSGMPLILILMLGALSGIIMIMACFNYTSLMLAKSLSRAREIGVRKVVGAKRWQVFAQFIGEAVVFSLTALVLAYGVLQLLKPAFMQFYFFKEYPVRLEENFLVYFYFIVFASIVGATAGLLPASYLSAFRPARVLAGSSDLKIYSRLTLRKMLVVTQFALSIGFIVIMLVVYQQATFMVKRDYSLHEDDIFNVYLHGVPFEKFAIEVRRLPGVERVGGVSHALGTYADRYGTYRRSGSAEKFQMRDFIVDDNYISNLQLTFLSGTNFDPAIQGLHETHVILNERALREFNFENPGVAIGRPVFTGDSTVLTVVGVVKNFNFRPLNYEIGPLALRYSLKRLAFLSASIDPTQQQSVTSSIIALMKSLDPIHPFEGVMMRDQVDNAYWNGGFRDIIQVVGYISVISIIMACLGVLGMSMYAIQTRIKEIGVRKVMGASVKQITILLSRSFLSLILVGISVGLPIGYLLGIAFLEDFAYKTEIGPLQIISVVLSVVGLGLMAIGSQTWKAAQEDPVKALRHE